MKLRHKIFLCALVLGMSGFFVSGVNAATEATVCCSYHDPTEYTAGKCKTINVNTGAVVEEFPCTQYNTKKDEAKDTVHLIVTRPGFVGGYGGGPVLLSQEWNFITSETVCFNGKELDTEHNKVLLMKAKGKNTYVHRYCDYAKKRMKDPYVADVPGLGSLWKDFVTTLTNSLKGYIENLEKGAEKLCCVPKNPTPSTSCDTPKISDELSNKIFELKQSLNSSALSQFQTGMSTYITSMNQQYSGAFQIAPNDPNGQYLTCPGDMFVVPYSCSNGSAMFAPPKWQGGAIKAGLCNKDIDCGEGSPKGTCINGKCPTYAGVIVPLSKYCKEDVTKITCACDEGKTDCHLLGFPTAQECKDFVQSKAGWTCTDTVQGLACKPWEMVPVLDGSGNKKCPGAGTGQITNQCQHLIQAPTTQQPILQIGPAEEVDIATLAKQLNKLPDKNISDLLGRMISVAMGILGSIALAMIVYAGFLWMLAAGNAEKSKKARDILIWAGLGIVVIFASYALVDLVFEIFR